MQQSILTKVQKTAWAVAGFLLRPFTHCWPFFVSMLALYVAVKLLVNGGTVLLKDAMPELYVIAMLLSFLCGKARTIVSLATLVVMGTLAIIEAFLMTQFNLDFMGEVFRLMLESSPSETSQFLDTFVFQMHNIKFVVLLSCFIILALALHAVKARWGDFDMRKSLASKCVSCMVVLAVIAHFIYSGWIPAQYYIGNVLLAHDLYDFEMRYIYGREHGSHYSKTSITRLVFGLKLYHLSTLQCDELLNTSKNARIDSCSHTSPCIILFIGESFIKRHAQVYGYNKATTPRLMQELREGNLTVIDDAVTTATQTSEVIKNMLSLHSIEQPGTWTSAPMVMQLMKQAGYRVSFVTNQYAATEHNVWNSTGGFFLRDPRVSHLLLDYQTPASHDYDDALLAELDQAITPGKLNLNIFHVRGQHVAYDCSYPASHAHFTAADYRDRTELSADQKQVVAHYDNSTLYQDSIFGVLFDRYVQQDVVLVFASDHGENAYDDGKTLGRVHDDKTPAMIESQYQVPMWIWYSPRYKELHPEMVEKIQMAAHRPFQTDDIPHLILELAGVKCKYFDPARSLINDQFNTSRPRKVTVKK